MSNEFAKLKASVARLVKAEVAEALDKQGSQTDKSMSIMQEADNARSNYKYCLNLARKVHFTPLGRG